MLQLLASQVLNPRAIDVQLDDIGGLEHVKEEMVRRWGAARPGLWFDFGGGLRVLGWLVGGCCSVQGCAAPSVQGGSGWDLWKAEL